MTNTAVRTYIVSIPHRQATNSSKPSLSVFQEHRFNPSQVGYKPKQGGENNGGETWFQSLIGRLQTSRPDQGSEPVNEVSIPHRQATNYRYRFPEPHFINVSIPHRQATNIKIHKVDEELIAGFNPSQVGYKQRATICGLRGTSSFNPSQVGYKPKYATLTKRLAHWFQSLIGRLQTYALLDLHFHYAQVSIPHRQATNLIHFLETPH